MSHDVRIDKIPLTTREGNIRPGKYLYKIRCKRRGCGHLGETTGAARAEVVRSEHFLDVKLKHEAAHPKDDAFRRTNRNKTKKAERMAKLRG